MKKRAFITGITGQDGSYLAELLLHKGYEVHGLVRRSSTFNTSRLRHLYQGPHELDRRLFLHYGDMGDASRLSALLGQIKPDEVYNLAAQSHVRVSFEEPVQTGEVTAIGPTRLLEAIKSLKLDTKFYQASSSEMFGSAPAPQNEQTKFEPRSPYAGAKLYAHWITKNYREAHGIYAVSGILFNHESPRRGETFLTRKVTRAVAEIASGQEETVYLGDLSPKRDWGYAPDYVVAIWRMMQLDQPKDLVIGTGTSSTVRDFVAEAFNVAGLNYEDHVKFDEKYLRPTEVEVLEADASLAIKALSVDALMGWKELARLMTEQDIAKLENSAHVDIPNSKLWSAEWAR